MTALFNTMTTYQDLIGYLLIDMVIAILFLSAFRAIMGLVGKIDTTNELAVRDNFAYGISLAGGFLAMGIALSGAITGESAGSLLHEVFAMLLYGTLGLLLIKAGRYLHDKLALPAFKKDELILEENISIGIADAASVIATAIIVRAALIWVDGVTFKSVVAIFFTWLISQVILVVITKVFSKRYALHNNGVDFQQSLKKGHTALAIRYAGYLIPTAMSVTAASHFVEYDAQILLLGLINWGLFSILLILAFTAFSSIAKRIVLWGVNRQIEIEEQDNIGVALIEFSTSFVIALLLMALMG